MTRQSFINKLRGFYKAYEDSDKMPSEKEVINYFKKDSERFQLLAYLYTFYHYEKGNKISVRSALVEEIIKTKLNNKFNEMRDICPYFLLQKAI